MKSLRTILGITALLLAALSAHAQMIPDNVGKSSAGLPPVLRNVGFDPQLNAQMPLDVKFRDESGREVALREYFGKKPVLLAFVYYSCPMLCNQVEQSVVGVLKMISFNAGKDYDVVFVSFDPRDTPQQAMQKKEDAISRYARPGTENGWHFLTGSQESIAALTKAGSFRFTFDDKTQLFAHASGILLLTPDGRISRYFFGVEYPPRDVRFALVDASAGKIGTPVDHLLLFCYQYDPTQAKYSATILTIMRAGGILTLLCLVLGFVIYRRREVRAGHPGDPGSDLHSQGAH
jgi:protein SCO1/2